MRQYIDALGVAGIAHRGQTDKAGDKASPGAHQGAPPGASRGLPVDVKLTLLSVPVWLSLVHFTHLRSLEAGWLLGVTAGVCINALLFARWLVDRLSHLKLFRGPNFSSCDPPQDQQSRLPDPESGRTRPSRPGSITVVFTRG